jgi:hypothetical protein
MKISSVFEDGHHETATPRIEHFSVPHEQTGGSIGEITIALDSNCHGRGAIGHSRILRAASERKLHRFGSEPHRAG